MAGPELVELLAHLDLLVEGPKTWSLQDSNSDEQVENVLIALAGSLGDRYSVDQIRDELWQVFEQGDVWPEYNFPRLFLHGSCEIQFLRSEERIAVKERLEILRRAKSSRPRSLRARSRPPNSLASANRSHGARSSPARSTPRSCIRDRRTVSAPKDACRKKASPNKAHNKNIPEKGSMLMRLGSTPPKISERRWRY